MIETERLRLRMFVPDDLDALAAIWGDREVMRYILTEPRTREQTAVSLQRMIERWQTQSFGIWAIAEKPGGELLGYGGFQLLAETPEVELLYGLARKHWGRGLATEAARACLRYGFEEAQLPRIVAVADPQNVGSYRVMEKIGMRYEKLTRHYGFEVVCYALTREEFQPDGSLYVLRRS